MSCPGVASVPVAAPASDDAALDQLIVSLGMAKIHFYRAMQIATNLRHRDNSASLSERLQEIHEELNHISGFAESRKS